MIKLLIGQADEAPTIEMVLENNDQYILGSAPGCYIYLPGVEAQIAKIDTRGVPKLIPGRSLSDKIVVSEYRGHAEPIDSPYPLGLASVFRYKNFSIRVLKVKEYKAESAGTTELSSEGIFYKEGVLRWRRNTKRISGSITLGSDPTCDYVIEGDGISKEHAKIIYVSDLGQFYLEDSKSKNGTYIGVYPNRVKVEGAVLLKGTTLFSLGSVTFSFALAGQRRTPDSVGGVISRDRELRGILTAIKHEQVPNIPILIHGERGTGKEAIARAIHGAGYEAYGQFLKINCLTFDPNELPRPKVRSTIYLEHFEHLGREDYFDIVKLYEEHRVIASSIRPTHHGVAISFHLSTLMERRCDIVPIFEKFLEELRFEGSGQYKLTECACALLLSGTWLRNAEELREVAMHTLFVAKTNEIDASHLECVVRTAPCAIPQMGLADQVSWAEEVGLRVALRKTWGNAQDAWTLLNTKKSTFYSRLQTLGMDLADVKKEAVYREPPVYGYTREEMKTELMVMGVPVHVLNAAERYHEVEEDKEKRNRIRSLEWKETEETKTLSSEHLGDLDRDSTTKATASLPGLTGLKKTAPQKAQTKRTIPQHKVRKNLQQWLKLMDYDLKKTAGSLGMDEDDLVEILRT